MGEEGMFGLADKAANPADLASHTSFQSGETEPQHHCTGSISRSFRPKDIWTSSSRFGNLAKATFTFLLYPH